MSTTTTEERPYKYSFTINTDASFNPDYKIAAFAFWIKSTHYKLTGSELIPGKATNIQLAELTAFEQALWRLDHLVDEDEFLRHERDTRGIRLYVNTDSMFTVHAITGVMQNGKHLDRVETARNIPDHYELVVRHIYAHQSKKDPEYNTARRWVNDWCDAQAKRLVRERVAEIKKSQPQKRSGYWRQRRHA